MRLAPLATLPLFALALAACESEAERQADRTEDLIERQADASAAAAGDPIVALGLTERQLLDADLVAADGTDLGDVEQVRRGLDGKIEGLVVEIDDSDPDRFVIVPLDGLTTRPDGDETDVQTTLTREQLAALPDAAVDPVAPSPTS